MRIRHLITDIATPIRDFHNNGCDTMVLVHSRSKAEPMQTHALKRGMRYRADLVRVEGVPFVKLTGADANGSHERLFPVSRFKEINEWTEADDATEQAHLAGLAEAAKIIAKGKS